MPKPSSTPNEDRSPTLHSLMEQAIALQQNHRHADAEKIYRRIIDEVPDQPDALHYWGLLKHQTGDSLEAVRLMKISIEKGVANPNYFYNLGCVLEQQGNLVEAASYVHKALELIPTHAMAWNNLGGIYERLNQTFKASDCYRRAYSLEPTRRQFNLNLARILRTSGELSEAIGLYEADALAHPEEPQTSYVLAQCLIDAGRTQDASEVLNRALQTHPDSAQLHHAMGMLMSELGVFEAAKGHFRQAIALDPRHYGSYFSLSMVQDFASEGSFVAELESSLQHEPIQNPVARVSAEFALGKMLEDLQEYTRAFEHFERGNRTMRGLLNYSSEAQAAYVDSLAAHLDAAFIARRSNAGSSSHIPIFIVGMIRSGTSLVEQILAGHPQVSPGGELRFLPQSLRKYTESVDVVTGARIAALSDDALSAIRGRYLGKLAEFHPGARWVTDKLPGNFLLVGLIRTLFPKARIIHCKRDPLDTCLSCYLTYFDGGHPYAYDLREVGEYYRIYHRFMTRYEGIIDNHDMLTVHYEELVSDFEKGARRLVEFCGLDWDPRCLELGTVHRPVKTASLYQVRQAPHVRSINRWQRYAAHIEPLRSALGALST